MALVSKYEVITGAFTRTIQESRIPDDLLEVTQYKYIRPILGEDFYDAVVATPGDYTSLLAYVKPIIYWYCKYMILPELRHDISDLGTNTININGATAVTDEGFAAIRDQVRIIAEAKVTMLNDYLDENMAAYPLYYKGRNASEKCKVSGGIVMKKRTDYFEDGPDNWK